MLKSLENGGCTLQVGVPKYKRRKISCVRDFPLGCGPNAPRINERPSNGSTADCGDQKPISEIKSKFVLDKKNEDAPGILELKDIEFVKSSREIHADTSREDNDSSTAHEFSLPLTEAACGYTFLEKITGHKYPPRRKISAIRDFPLHCGRDTPRITKEECIKVRDSMKQSALSLEKVETQNMKFCRLLVPDPVKSGNDTEPKGSFRSKGSHVSSQNLLDRTPASDRPCDIKKTLMHDLSSSQSGNADENPVGTLGEYVHLQGDHGFGVEKGKVDLLTLEQKSVEQISIDNSDVLGVGGHEGEKTVLHNPKNDCLEQKMGGPDHKDERDSRGLWYQKDKGLKLRSSSGMKKSKVKKLFADRRASLAVSKIKKSSSNCINVTPLRSTYPNTMKMEEDKNSFNLAEGSDQFCVDTVINRRREIDLPPVVPRNVKIQKGSADCISCNKVRETLRLFQAVFRRLTHEDEEIKRKGGIGCKRIDLKTHTVLREMGKFINTQKVVGSLPGVDVGLEFQYRVELMVIGLHCQSQAGIDTTKFGGKSVATSVVASGGYADDMDSSDVLIYSGCGGLPSKTNKQPEDQKLVGGNLALKNSIAAKTPVRVIRGHDHKVKADSSDSRTKIVKTYTYDGLYLVTKFWQEIGPHGKLVYMFRLERIPGQPELAWNVIRKSKKSKVRQGVCKQDISEGKEPIPICAINTIDSQMPPPFKYITRMVYPDWCRRVPCNGCNCVGGCSDSASCSCAVRNGGEIPYNSNGSIVEVKPLVYECGSSCKCPPTCANRVSQHGIRFQLEIFKTESRGWGVRSLNSIPSGSFVCEYLGELLEDRQAEKRIGSDEYLFDVGNNFTDQKLLDECSNLKHHSQLGPSEVVDDAGFTIDAGRYGNVGRFINHSCSPNMYAQNVIYDHDDRRIPHIMLFAAENIPPLQELTYHYNYTIGEVFDVNGNEKIKHCFCGSADCTGRLY